MNNLTEMPTENIEIVADIQFLIKEINFLLKLLKNGYSHSIKSEKIKLLDSFWKGFEDNLVKLKDLLSKIEGDTGNYSFKSNTLGDSKKHPAGKEFKRISSAVNAIKDNFYLYMDGCCSCSFKN